MVSTQIETAEIPSKGGYKVQFRRAGNKEGPNLILLHPAGGTPLGMDEAISQLALGTESSIIVPNMFDLVGSLRQRGNKNPSFADMVNEFSNFELINERKPTQLVGISWGGSFAWEYATQFPNQVDSITTASPTGWPLNRSRLEWAWEFIKMRARHQFRVPPGLKSHDQGPTSFLKQLQKDPLATWYGLGMAMKTDARQQLANIKQPVDLLWGERDTMIPAWSGRRMEELLENGRFSYVSEESHQWYSYEPAKFTQPAIQRARAIS